MTDQYYRSRFPLPTVSRLNGLGANLHFLGDHKGALTDLKSTGMKWVRTDIVWSDIERTPGVYTWYWYDEHFKWLQANGFRSVIILHINPIALYHSKREAADPSKNWSLDLDNPTQVDAFKKFVKEVVKRYGNQGHIWETGNEPFVSSFYHPGRDPIHYAKVSYLTTLAIREISKYEWVASNALALNQYKTVTDYVETYFKQTPNPFNYIDIFSFHPYTWTSEPYKENVNPEMIAAGINRLKECLNRFKPKGKVLRLICSEHGGSEYQGYSFKPGEGTDILGSDADFRSPNWIHYWTKPTITYDVADPFGGRTAIRLKSADKAVDNPCSGIRIDRANAFTYPCYVTISFWARAVSGTMEVWFGPRDATKSTCIIDTKWRQYYCTYRMDSPVNNNMIIIYETEFSNPDWELCAPKVEINTLPKHTIDTFVPDVDTASELPVTDIIATPDAPEKGSDLYNHRRNVQVDYSIESIKACLNNGVALYIYYNYKDDGSNPNEFYSTFGMVEEDHTTKKPLFHKIKEKIAEWKLTKVIS